ncbi:MAG: ChaN family lipoprotein [Thermodesulfobacteriota bacterium]
MSQSLPPAAAGPGLMAGAAGPALALGLFLLLLLVALPGTGLAQMATPVYRLSVAFDLARGRLLASARIDLPAELEERIVVGDLILTRAGIEGTGEPLAAVEGVISLPAAAQPRTLVLDFERQFAAATDGGLVSPQGVSLTGFWHPMLQHDSLFDLDVVVPPDWEAVAEAELVRSTANDQEKRVRLVFPRPLPGLDLLAGPYQVSATSFGDGQELLLYFFPEDAGLMADYQAKALAYLEGYRQLLGSFPYRRFAVVENRLPTGFAVPTLTLLGQAVLRLPFIKDTSLGHEILHQWLGNAVRVDYSEGNWVEGLVTYLADYRFARQQGEAVRYRLDQLLAYESYVHGESQLALRDFIGAQEDDAAGRGKRAIGYGKALMVFHMLAAELGEEAFSEAVRDFYGRMRFGRATWSDLAASFERVGRLELGAFFAQWLERPDIPRLGVRAMEVSERDGRPLLSFVLTQDKGSPFRLHIPVSVETERGGERTTLFLPETERRFELPLAAEPRRLLIDPGFDLMRHLDRDELPPVWSRFLGASRRLIVCGDEGNQARFAALIAALGGAKTAVKSEAEVTDEELAGASVLFLDPEGPISRGWFASPRLPAAGFALEVRPHPLAPRQVAVLVAAASAEEVEAALPKLGHYGRSSRLAFTAGRNTLREEAVADQGLIVEGPGLPQGVASRHRQGLDAIADELLAKRIVYVGESHTNFQDHRLQLQVIRALYERDPKLAIGMEMFARPAQPALDEYVALGSDEPTFLKKSNYFESWGFDYRLYREIIDFARHHGIPVVALNLPREIVEKVFRDKAGITGLSAEELAQIPAERDLALPGYRQRLEAIYSAHGAGTSGQFAGFLQAQALWDESMAAAVDEFLADHPEHRMVVIAGRGHVGYREGIPERVFRRNQLPYAIVAPQESGDPEPEAADYLMFLEPRSLPPQPLLGVQLSQEEAGVTVVGFSPHGPAKAAGVQEKDVILALDGQAVEAVVDIRIALLYKAKGDQVRLRLLRPRALFPDEELELAVTL